MPQKRDVLTPEEKSCYEALPFGLSIFQTDGRAFHLLLVSDGLCSLQGYSRSELTEYFEQDPFGCIHPEDRQKVKEAEVYFSLHPQEELKAVYRVRKSDGAYLWISARGNQKMTPAREWLMFMHYANITDETELSQRLAEDSIHREKLLDLVLKTTSTAVFWKDADRRFLGANQAFLDYYGFADEKLLIGKNDEEMGWHSDPDPYKNDELRVIREGISTHRVHGRCLAKGENRDIVASKSPMYIDGRIVGLVGTFDDVTNEYRQREEISKLNSELQNRLQKETVLKDEAMSANRAKSEFLSRISHDIRTPLNGIIGMTYLASQQDNPAKTKDCLAKVDTSSKFLLGLINDVLDMSKAESGKIELLPEPYPVTLFENYISSVIQPLCDSRNQKLTVQIDADSSRIPLMDPLRINQIYFNLLSNAVKFTPEGGDIMVEIHAQAAASGKYAVDSIVKDNGIGMSRDFLARVFEPFTQENRGDVSESRGTGLGLSIVKKLVDLMAGTITVDSEIGRGTVFKMSFQFDSVAADQVRQAEQQPKELTDQHFCRLNGRHVLVCEDHPLNQEIVKAIFNQANVFVTIAEDGQIGLRKFAQSSTGFYDAILMDIRMPVMNGIDATKAIRGLNREDAKSIPIIALTADAFEEDIRKCIEAGMNGHIAKPIDPKQLLRCLAEAINQPHIP